MAVITFSNLIDLQNKIEPFGCKIHMHDACGGQSFSLETKDEKIDDEVYRIIESFFKDHRMTVSFLGENRLDFIAV